MDGAVLRLSGAIEHHDSPDLEHWLEKQNRYTTLEAVRAYGGLAMADAPAVFGTALQRRMWLKKNFYRTPFRYTLFFLYHLLVLGAWRSGWVGWTWSRLRSDVMRLIEIKYREIEVDRAVPR